jgi:hypothetical protein
MEGGIFPVIIAEQDVEGEARERAVGADDEVFDLGITIPEPIQCRCDEFFEERPAEWRVTARR